MITLTCVIVEDEKFLAKILEKMLKEEQLNVLGIANNADDAIRLVDKQKPDVLFLDINLGENDGFYVLKNVSHKPYVIFTTAYSEYAVKAFEENAVDYLLKPISKERLRIAIDKVRKFIEASNRESKVSSYFENARTLASKIHASNKIPIETDHEIVLVNWNDILYFESDQGTTIVTLKDKSFRTKTPLKEYEAKLPADKFLRVHKSFIVSIDAISKILKNYFGGNAIELVNGKIIPIGRMYKGNIKNILNI
ncbi:MAG: LytR/AlgR family response regulator transcription factor [Fervidobacterium sp.]